MSQGMESSRRRGQRGGQITDGFETSGWTLDITLNDMENGRDMT